MSGSNPLTARLAYRLYYGCLGIYGLRLGWYSGPGVILYFFCPGGNYLLNLLPWNLPQNGYFLYAPFSPYLTSWCPTASQHPYIDILAEVVLVLRLSVKGVPRVCAYPPLRAFAVVELVCHMIVRSFWGLLSVTVHNCHLLWNELLRFCITGRCSKWELGSGGLFTLMYLSEPRVYLCAAELNQVLISVDLGLLLILCCLCHRKYN